MSEDRNGTAAATDAVGATWRRILDEADLKSLIERLGEEITEACRDKDVAFVGIRARGVPLAARLAAIHAAKSGTTPPQGILDIALYRDDFDQSPDWPEVRESRIDFEIAGKTIVLVDDVLYTGRTIRAALNALMDFGRPRTVLLAVVVDRGLRELPIQADFVGHRAATSRQDHIRVRVAEIDGVDEVVVEEQRAATRRQEAKPCRRRHGGRSSAARRGEE
jgi:pyrimidine operon attenuation protein/uracil phosphoribosyltransferase